MELVKSILMGIYVAIGLYIMYRVFLRKSPYQEEYERMYNDIIHSKKYKVKGQYDKKE